MNSKGTTTMGDAMVAEQAALGRAMLSLQQLRKVFRTEEIETTALDDVNIDIARGEFVSIMGPSGCGKSTLLNIIGLLDNVDGGQYWFLGEEVSGYGERKLAQLRKHNIGFIFQSFNLIDELSVTENVELALLYHGDVSARQRKKRAAEALERMKIGHRARHMPSQLSGGQQQRVAIARAVVARPKLILADEPTGNLDTANGEEVMQLLTQLNDEGTTIVMVTHSHSHAEYAHRIVNLLDGAIVTESIRQVL
jgi:putative ABC transport system ATP-binding protein